MHEQPSAGLLSRVVHFIRDRAFYLILFLCVTVVGITAWLFTAAIDRTKPTEQQTLQQHAATAQPLHTAQPDEGYHWAPPSIAPQEAADAAAETKPAEVIPEPETSVEDATEVMATAFTWPLSGAVCAGYSVDALQYDRTMADWRTHAGMDIEGELGAKVKAAADGTVERIYVDPMYGETLILYHGGGLRSVYYNLAAIPAVSIGDVVTIGQVIGSVGHTADAETGDVTHLHFAMTLDELRVNPLDYLPGK